MLPRTQLASSLLLLVLLLSFFPAGVTVGHAAAVTACDSAQFVADVTVPDGTSYAPGTTFKKTWRLKNIGTCNWTTSYSLAFDSGEKMGASTPLNLPITVAPGQTVDLSVDMTAPSAAGSYIGYWKFKNVSGVSFGIGSAANGSFWVKINVTSGGGTSGGTGYDFVANAASATWSSGAGVLPFPGADGDSRGFAISGLHSVFEDNSSPASSMLVSPQQITNGYVQGIYPAFTVQTGDRFQAQVGCELQATSCYVQYRLDYQIGSGAVINYWTFREKWEGLTKSAVVNLDRLAGQDVKFILVVSAFGSPTGDRAVWGGPLITRSGGGTPPPGSCTDAALFVSDGDVPDGKIFAPGQTFTKTWQIKNIGTCTWTTSYSLIFDHEEKMGGPDSLPFPRSIAPKEILSISVPLTAPNTAGTKTGYWKFENNNGAPFGLCPLGNCFLGNQKAFWVKINVSGTISKALALTTTANPLTYDQVGQTITYTYVVKNSGTESLGPAQFTVSDSLIGTAPINCGPATTSLAPNATVTCTATYTITQADLTAVSVTNLATASGGGAGPSQSASATVNKAAKALTLTTAASPLTYNQLGQTITFTYVVKNSGNVSLGPAQFTVSDSLIGTTPINCGNATTSLAPNAIVTCTATYTITQADLNAVSVTNLATASGGGAGPSQSASATVNKQ